MGPVFRAYDAERERLVAVKLFKLDLPPERVHQLVSALEDLIVAELSHPVMAVPLATGINGVSAYLAQDYVAAESVDQALREYGPAPVADAIRVAAQLAGALDFAAVVNVAHGSLHPRDLLISSDETRLTGIGIARALEKVGVAAPVRRPYSAPERVAGAAWDRRADVFSLAAVTHELIWGRRITGTGAHAADALTAIEGTELQTLQDLFARALADDPNDRFATALEFAEALKSAFPAITIAAQAPVRPRPAVEREPEHAPPRLPLDEPEAAAAVPLSREPIEAVEPLRASTPAEPLEPLAFSAPAPRYQDVDQATPELPIPEVRVRDDYERLEPPAGLSEPPPISVLERSRSAVWPLMAALAIGLAIGFAGGYGVSFRDHATAPVATQAANDSQPAPVAAPPGGGRESTEVAVGDAPKPATPPARAAAPQTGRQTAPTTTGAPVPGRQAAGATPPMRGLNVPPSQDVATKRPATPAPTTRATAPPIRSRERVTASRTPPPQPARPAERTAATPASGTAGRFVGSLYVASRPEGARVYLDGKLIGSTPLEVPNVPAGEHAIRLESDGYRRWSSSVRVVASERNRVTASLER